MVEDKTYPSYNPEKTYLGGFTNRMPMSQVTVQNCVTECFSMRYKMAALLRGDECYCGYQTSQLLPVDHRVCYMPCTNNCRQRCGGPKAVSVYQTGYQREPYLLFDRDILLKGTMCPTVGYIGCYKWSVVKQILYNPYPNKKVKPLLKTVRMTPHLCALYCHSGKVSEENAIAILTSIDE
ncbi:hypothetical protein ACOMHN_064429 [Nucella lapillus]